MFSKIFHQFRKGRLEERNSTNTVAWQIGVAIEAGIDESLARQSASGREFAVPVAGGLLGGGVAATATGLGGVGLAMGGGAIGVGAVTAIAAPAVAVGAVSYGVYKAFQGVSRRNREETIRGLIQHFQDTDQPRMIERIFTIEGMGRLDKGRRPPAKGSAAALHEILASSSSDAFVGLFCSPNGEFVLTYDLPDERWAFLRLVNEDHFTGGGRDRDLEEFDLDVWTEVKQVLQILRREGFLSILNNTDTV